ncbi:MAG TPA: flagellar hook-associated protein FlgK [Acidobacteriota bacterium]|nr:flagellar hook-associated protein FlgK [Acidobacteriota bacterium]
MSGLFTIMRNNVRSLTNFQAGLAVVSDNVANVNTAGYTRKRALFTSTRPELRSYGFLGTGAEISRVEGVRDFFIERRLITELQSQGFYQGQQFGLQQIEGTVFSSTESGIPDQISRFFNSFSDLTNDGSSLALRQAAISEGERLADQFNTAFQRLGRLALDNHQQIEDTVGQINSLSQRIADLNGELTRAGASGQDGGVFQDQRQQALEELAQLVEFRVVSDENGIIDVTTTSGAPLVLGTETKELRAETSAGSTAIFVENREVTGDITGGELGGQLLLDRQTIPSFIGDLNLLAEEIASQVNAAHSGGEDLNGNAGQPFFSFTPGGAAGTLSVAISDPRQVAARNPGSGPGNVDIAQQIADLREQPFAALGDSTFSEFHSDVVFRAGLESRNVQESLSVQQVVVRQVTNARDSVSAVSLDEEAANLVQFQRAYEASARFFQVVDRLLEETMNLI